MKKIYGLTQLGNRYFYAMQNLALVVQLKPRPIAWRKTPSSSWQRTHENVVGLNSLGFWSLELDPVAEFDRSSAEVYRLVPSNGQFDFEVDWNDAISFPNWAKDTNWREIVSNLIDEIDPKVLIKLREFSHFNWRVLEALHEWPGFIDLLEINPALAVCLAGRLRVGAKNGGKRPRLDYKSLYRRTEREIAAAIGFGDSDAMVSILRKVPPDACKPHDLSSLADLIENPVTRKTLLAAEVISHPALLLLRNPFLSRHLTGDFITEISRFFSHSLDILTCPWGPLLRGGGKEDEFTWRYQQALDVVQFAEDPTIYSIEDLVRKHSAVALRRLYHPLPG
jgi:hypothetical protein